VDIALEPMQADDLADVMEIERRSFNEPWTPGLFLHELKVPFSRVMILRATNGRRVTLGYVCRWIVGQEGHILNLAVHPDHRGRGLGQLLVESVIADTIGAGAESVTLEVRRGNRAALRLYQKLGFVEQGVRKNYYGKGDDALIMTRVLGAPCVVGEPPDPR
jgi:ribosomal-protein-alanine N-acetyltransferase